MLDLLRKIFGTKNDRTLKRMMETVRRVNALEAETQRLGDADLAASAEMFRGRLKAGETLDDILPEVFARAREAGRRARNMRHFDVQLIGGMALHEGKIAEMATGEGKTLVATLAAALNAMTGRGVHVITVNDYLARRDTEWMGPIYRALGLTVGCIQHDMPNEARRAAYACDITYGTNSEFGFDYLRDNMKYSLAEKVQRGHFYAIVDEVDSILIDEARTPLIISGPSEQSTDLYQRANQIALRLKRGEHYLVNEEDHVATLTEEGVREAERLYGVDNLYDPAHINLLHHLQQSVRAHGLYERDVDYVVKEGQVIIVDEFTGRMMPGRRWSDGLHQAVEAKEGVKIESENQTIATVTLQNYFRMYEKLAGMTGTAATEAAEFEEIYRLEVVQIPTNRPLRRIYDPDTVYATEKEKFKAIAAEIDERHRLGQPMLVGTVSIEKSERLSSMLERRGVRHQVLNAKFHEKEAAIVAQAGRKGAVTIATNMAGRGTDILLGGNPEFLAKSVADPEKEPEKYAEALARYAQQCRAEHEEVVAAGGLRVIGTERHESRRIDNQLRGRSGRQGDPGSTRFYLSLEDDLMRIFGGDRVKAILQKVGLREDEPIEHRMVTNAIERSQKKVEERNFDIRKHLLKYDDVFNIQRKAFYALRDEVLGREDQGEFVMEQARAQFDLILDAHAGAESDPMEWNDEGFRLAMQEAFGLVVDAKKWFHEEKLSHPELEERAWKAVEEKYAAKRARLGESFRSLEKMVILHFMDMAWKDHLLDMDHLKEGIGLRGYGQRDPLVEYKRESLALFEGMQERVRESIIQYLFRIEPAEERPAAAAAPRRAAAPSVGKIWSEGQYDYRGGDEQSAAEASVFAGGGGGGGGAYGEAADPRSMVRGKRGGPSTVKTVVHAQPKTGRNDPCPCGSGKKYKKCHGGMEAGAAG